MSTEPAFSLSLLSHVKAAQLSNGLRHNNFLKYRRYCSNRLRTLRKHLKFSHQKTAKQREKEQKLLKKRELKRAELDAKAKAATLAIVPASAASTGNANAAKEVPVPVSTDDKNKQSKKKKAEKEKQVTFQPRRLKPDFEDPRYPLLALVQAERAWAYAMQLKQDAESQTKSKKSGADNPRLKFHSLQRLRKAVYWARKLRALANARGDERTALECDAYACWLTGGVEMECNRWETALENFVKTRTIYTQLHSVSGVVEQDLFSRRMAEIDTQIDFIQYKIDLNNGKGTSAGLIAQMASSGAKGGLGLLQSKLDLVLSEERKKNASTLSRVEWCGHFIPIDNEKVRIAILHAKDTATRLEQLQQQAKKSDNSNNENKDSNTTTVESAEFEEVYFDLMARYDDAQQLVERDIANVSKVTLKADEVKLQMGLLRSYIKSSKLHYTIQKNTAMFQAHSERFRDQQREFGKRHQRPVRATDIVKLLDTLLQNIADALALQGASNDLPYQNRFRFKHGVFSACRCFHVAEALSVRKCYAEANACYVRALDMHAKAADGDISAAESGDLKLLSTLGVEIEGGRCRCLALHLLHSNNAAHGENGAESTAVAPSVLDRAQEYRVTSAGDQFPFSIASIPPSAKPVALNPLFFDLVRDDIVPPDTARLVHSGAAASAKDHSPTAAASRGGDDGDDDSDEFESVSGDSDEDSDSTESEDEGGSAGQPNKKPQQQAKSSGGILGAARSWFGKK